MAFAILNFNLGDTLVVHTCWEDLERLQENSDFIVITSQYPKQEESRPEKVKWAGVFFSLALFWFFLRILNFLLL